LKQSLLLVHMGSQCAQDKNVMPQPALHGESDGHKHHLARRFDFLFFSCHLPIGGLSYKLFTSLWTKGETVKGKQLVVQLHFVS
jgi:hypothetical protein